MLRKGVGVEMVVETLKIIFQKLVLYFDSARVQCTAMGAAHKSRTNVARRDGSLFFSMCTI